MSENRGGEAEKGDREGGEKRRGSRIIGRVLPGAVRLWLRSQLENVGQLDIQLEGRDREIISGRLPRVAINAEGAIYQGLHIGSVALSAEDICINVGQIIRGKPLKLLKGFPVLGEIKLSAEDLEASADSALLLAGVTDFWRGLSQLPQLAEEIQNRYGTLPLSSDVVVRDLAIALGEGSVGLSFYPQSRGEVGSEPIAIGAKLALVSGRFLQLSAAKWLSQLADLNELDKGVAIQALEGFEWDIGTDTQLSRLILNPDRLLCAGQIQVRP